MATERLRDRKLALWPFSPKDGSTCLEDGEGDKKKKKKKKKEEEEEKKKKKKAIAQYSAEGALVKYVMRG